MRRLPARARALTRACRGVSPEEEVEERGERSVAAGDSMAGIPGKGKRRQKEQHDAERTSEGLGPEGGQGSAPEQGQVLFPPSFSVSEIKNKQRRHFMFLRWKQQQRKVRVVRGREGGWEEWPLADDTSQLSGTWGA